jgi:RNA polymerase sigma-70 factor (ECF subfamily)
MTVAPGIVDDDAFTALVRAHQAMVFSLAWRIVAQREVAEELAQDVFCELFQHLGELESDRHVLFWLRQVTTRRAIDQLRRARLRPRVGLESAPEPIARAADSDPWRDQRLQACVAELPPDQRIAVTLRYQEDMDPMEIARMLGENVNTIKSRLQRALQTLRTRTELMEVVS